MLTRFARALPVVQAAAVYPEDEFEARLVHGDVEGLPMMQEGREHLDARQRYLYETVDPRRARKHVEQLQGLYQGRCQVCGYNPVARYSHPLCHGHHTHWLSRGGEDALDNLVLVCPSHHVAVHPDDAPFDYGGLSFVFSTGLVEPLVVNEHLPSLRWASVERRCASASRECVGRRSLSGRPDSGHLTTWLVECTCLGCSFSRVVLAREHGCGTDGGGSSMSHSRTRRHRLGCLLGAMLLLLGVLVVSPSAAWSQATSLFFSEYVEGSSNNKALEIYNGTGAAVDLAAEGYEIKIYFNGDTTALTTISLTGVIPNGAVYVVADDGADPAILAKANELSTDPFFNGDDAVALLKGGTVIDVIGQIGVDPGAQWGTGLISTQDNTLRRRANVCAGDPDGTNAFEPSIEWLGYAVDTFDGLGTHTASCIDIGALVQELELLKGRVEQLEATVGALLNHTHTYRTGRGEGHNNVEATTGPAQSAE